MSKFISFNGDTVWWNIDLFTNIGIGYGKYGLSEWNIERYAEGPQRDILGFRSAQPGNIVQHGSIVLFTGKDHDECQKILDIYETIKDIEVPERIWLEVEHESYDASLFHKIEIIKDLPYDGHNSMAWYEYEIQGRYIDPKNSEWQDEESKWDGWFGSELLYCSQVYGECEKAAEKCPHLFTLTLD